ncbi:hypothetical protein [Prevotella sp.]|uniref:hypothetical protein n=1 Tax=Prevotella sp. TaxID=59823 RepID=UPI003FD7702B
MNKYIKPETKIVEVKIESLLNDASFDRYGGTVIYRGRVTSSVNSWEDSAGKNHQAGYSWDEMWEDPEEEENQ